MLRESITASITSKLANASQQFSSILLSALAVFAPLQSVLYALLFLVCTDFVTGMYASLVTKTPITSRRLARTIVKTFVYLITICVVFITNKYLLSAGDFTLPLDTLIVAFISLTELKSILENLQKIQKQPILQFVIDRIASDSSRVVEQLERPEPKAVKKKEKKRGTSNRQK